MTRYAISQQGADALRQLAQDIRTSVDSISDDGNALRGAIAGLQGLGVYESQITEAVAGVNLAATKGSQAVESLITKLNGKASEIDVLVSAGLS